MRVPSILYDHVVASNGNQRQAGWHVDPFGRYERRWWSGTSWTERVRTGAQAGIDPPGIVPAPRAPIEEEPVEPIVDALVPIKPPKASPQITWWLGWVVMVILLAAIIASLVALS